MTLHIIIKVLNMLSGCRIIPHLEGHLDNLLRGAPDLYPAEPPFEGLNPPHHAQKRVLGSREEGRVTGLGLLLVARCRTFGARKGSLQRTAPILAGDPINERAVSL